MNAAATSARVIPSRARFDGPRAPSSPGDEDRASVAPDAATRAAGVTRDSQHQHQHEQQPQQRHQHREQNTRGVRVVGVQQGVAPDPAQQQQQQQQGARLGPDGVQQDTDIDHVDSDDDGLSVDSGSGDAVFSSSSGVSASSGGVRYDAWEGDDGGLHRRLQEHHQRRQQQPKDLNAVSLDG